MRLTNTARRSAARRIAARRLALRLAFGLLSTGQWSPAHHPFDGDWFTTLEWGRRQLAPLARHDRLVRDLLPILNPENPPRPWSRPTSAKRALFKLASAAQAFAGRPPKQAKLAMSSLPGQPGHAGTGVPPVPATRKRS